MTDHENNWTPHRIGCTCERCEPNYVTHEDLMAESRAITKALQKEHAKDMDVIRDQLYHLNKTHTVALMAATLWEKTSVPADIAAMELYERVEKAMKDEPIVDIPPAA